MPRIYTYRGSNRLIQEHDERNGKQAILRNGAYRYPNGALRDQDPLGFLIDPPSDPTERQKNVVSYWRHFIELAVEEFEAKRQEQLENAGHIVDVDAAEAELKALIRVVTQARKSQQATEHELLRVQLGAETIEEALRIKEKREQDAAECNQRNQERAQNAKSRLKSIRV
jgi:hypothetical protein